MAPKRNHGPPCVDRIKNVLLSKYGGSGDPELSDGLHCIDHFQQQYPNDANFKALLTQIMARIQLCDPAWVQPACITQIPLPPGPDEPAFEGWVHPWQLGFKETQALRGKPKMVNVLEVCFSLLDNGFRSQSNPLCPLFPSGAKPGSEIHPFSMEHAVGMTRSLSLKCVLEAISCCNLEEQDFRSILSHLKSYMCIKIIYEPAPNEEEQVAKSLRQKFQLSESTRPDVIQLYYLFKTRLGKARESVSPENIKRLIDSFNAQICVESHKISEAETTVLMRFPGVSETFMNALDYHWQNYKAAESAMPLKLLASPENFSVDISGAPGVWAAIYTPSPEKDTFTLLAHLGWYAKRVKDALRLKKKVKGQNFRRGGDNRELYRMSCLWVHFRSDFQQRLSTSEFEEVEKMFFRGTLERELKDKVLSENPTLSVSDFRFLENFSGNVQMSLVLCTDINAVDDNGVPLAQIEAEEEQERSALRVLELKLQKDTTKFDQYLHQTKDFEDKTRADRRKRAEDLKEKMSVASDQYCNMKAPVLLLEDETTFATKVSGAAGAFLEENMLPVSNAFYFYWVDPTKLGSSYKGVINKAIRLIADATAHNPSNTGTVLMAPNVASRGSKYDELAIEAAHDDVEVLLKNENLGLYVRRACLVFSAETPCRTRPATLPCWILMSNAVDDKGALVSSFANSKLFQTKGSVDIKRKQEVDFVNPTSLIFRGGDDFSKSQRLKQEVSGKDLYSKVRESLWTGMKLSPKHAGICIDVFGYDDSFAESIIAASLKSRPKEPTELLVTTIWAKSDVEGGDLRKRQVSWVMAAQRRYVERMVMEKYLKLDGVDVDAIAVPKEKPTYNTDDFLLCMPTAEGSLALRQSMLDEYQSRFARLQDQFQAMIANHDKKYNLSGVPYKSNGKRSAEPIEDQQASSFPEQDVKESKAELEKGGAIYCCPSNQPDVFELIISHKGQLYIHALADGIASNQQPLCNIHGKFHTGTDVEALDKANNKKNDDKKAAIMDVEIKDTGFIAQWAVPPSWPNPFSEGPKSLSDFLDFLLSEKNVVDPMVACHKLERIDDDDFKIERDTPVVFQPLHLPANYKADNKSFGSLTDFGSSNWVPGEQQGHTLIYTVWLYEDSNRNKGISPSTPALFLAQPMRLMSGKCYLVLGSRD